MKISARNQLSGKVVSISEGEVNVEVVLEVAPGVTVTAILTKPACKEMGLTVGSTAWAIFKATHVMLGVE